MQSVFHGHGDMHNLKGHLNLWWKKHRVSVKQSVSHTNELLGQHLLWANYFWVIHLSR